MYTIIKIKDNDYCNNITKNQWTRIENFLNKNYEPNINNRILCYLGAIYNVYKANEAGKDCILELVSNDNTTNIINHARVKIDNKIYETNNMGNWNNPNILKSILIKSTDDAESILKREFNILKSECNNI